MVEVRSRLAVLRELGANRFVVAVGRSMSLGIGNLLIRLLSIALLSRLLSADAFGAYFLGQSVALLLGIAGNLSFSYRVMETPDLRVREFAICMAWPLAAATAMGIGAWLGGELMAPGYVFSILGPSGLIIAATAPAMAALRTAEALARRLLEFRYLSWAEIVAVVAGLLVVAPALALAGFGAMALAAGHCCYVAVKLWLLLRHDLPRLPSVLDSALVLPARSGRMAAYGLELLDSVSVHFMRLVIGAAFGPAVVALWTRASQLILLGINLLMAPISNVLVPLALRDGERGEKLRTDAPLALDNLALLLSPAAITVFALAPEIVTIVLGPRWIDAAAYLQAFSLLVIGRTLQRAFGILGRSTRTSGIRILVDGLTLLAYSMSVGALLTYGPTASAWMYSITSCFAALVHFRLSSDRTAFVSKRFILSIIFFLAFAFVSSALDLGNSSLTTRLLVVAPFWLIIAASLLTPPNFPSILSTSALRQFVRGMDHSEIR